VNASFKIGNAFGIPVRIHATFLLLALAFYRELLEAPILSLGLTSVIFGCVLLHELGHSLVARSFGLRVMDITLWPLGGMARMSEIPENSRIEMLIAVAGPAVNFALAGLGFLALTVGQALGLGSLALLFISGFMAVNVGQGTFNLLPAFPMDGGRILRAFLGRKGDWLAATENAVRAGRWVAFLFLIASLLLLREGAANVCVLPLVALFIWFEGTRELWSVRMRHGVSPLGARPFGWRPAEPEQARDPAPPPSDEPLAPGSARRPRSWLQRLSRRGGFSEEEIRWLEAHRGPLRRAPEEENR
jgi:Zn-dependent protease